MPPVLTQVFDQPDEKESGGLYFPMAVNNLCKLPIRKQNHEESLIHLPPVVVGLYIEQICLACLFFLKTGKTAVVQAVFMLVLLVLTACAHTFIQNSFKREYSRPQTDFWE